MDAGDMSVGAKYIRTDIQNLVEVWGIPAIIENLLVIVTEDANDPDAYLDGKYQRRAAKALKEALDVYEINGI